MNEIRKLSDIDYTETNTIMFDATVLEVLSDGDGDKRPMRYTLKLEESGEILQVSSWKFEYLQELKALVNLPDIYRFEGTAGSFGNYGPQVRTGAMLKTGRKSNKKILRVENNDEGEIKTIIEKHITSPLFRSILERFIINNPNFFLWPAATSIHHNYKGGLAKHSLNVCKQCLAYFEIYKERIDKELLVAGALLHDLGKLSEYNADGTRTTFGNIIPHPVAGADMIYGWAIENGIDPNKDLNVLMLRHILLTHHGKLEFGASTRPYILEAHIISFADNTDAGVESAEAALMNLNKGTATERGLVALDGAKVLRWKE